MCILSMVIDHQHDMWKDRLVPTTPYTLPIEWNGSGTVSTITVEPPITQREIREFRELLRRAREYDAKHNQPDCEMAEKKERLKALLEQLQVTVEDLFNDDDDS